MTRQTLLNAAIGVLGLATVASAMPQGNCPLPINRCDAGCYDLGNKIGGQVAPPGYGLRLDGLFGAATDHWTFDFEDPQSAVSMCYDGAGTVTLQGIAFGGHDIGQTWDPQTTGLLEMSFTWINAVCTPGGDLIVNTANGGAGFGTVKYLPTGEVITLMGKANAAGDIFLFDTAVNKPARGWITYGDGNVGDFAMTITPSTDCPPPADCDGDGVPDSQESDCDQNGVPDDCEPGEDCDGNGIPDRCDILGGANDADGNGIPDICEPGVDRFCVGEGPAGTVGPCPCGNNVSPGSQTGCANSLGTGGTLDATGTTSIAAADLVLTVSGLPAGKPGIFFAGNLQVNGGLGTPFVDGLRCIGGNLVRINKIPSLAGGQGAYPQPGDMPIHQILGVSPGDTSYLQFWYRDPAGPCGTDANTTNALRVTWGI